MDFNSALDIIIKDLREARNIIDNLKKYREYPMIEIELAKAKCKSAEEILIMLKELGFSPTAQGSEKSEPVEAPVKSSPMPEVEPEIPGKSTISDIILEEEPDEELPPASPGKSKQKAVKPILADRYKDSGNRISEKVSSGKQEEDVTSKMKKKPIVSLREAIGINDRFYYIRELFGGNKDIYYTTIDKLDQTNSIIEAERLIEEFGSDNKSREAVEELMALIRRKPGIDE